MSLSEWLLPELDEEARFTRAHLERVPMDRTDFQVHEKSMTLGWLATFVAIMPSWGSMTLTQDSIDVAPKDGPSFERKVAESREQLLALFDANIASTRAALAAATDEQMRAPWSLLAGGNVLFTRPRFLVFRTFVLNHMIHHRAQLGVYLRLNGIAVPAVYNDSADERGGMFMDGASPAAAGARAAGGATTG
jgi:uncharacterized damage-inducible protein DinB